MNPDPLEFNPDAAISVRDIHKRYRLGVINRKSFRDELIYRWLRFRGKDPKQSMGKIGDPRLKSDGWFHALDGVSFDIRRGEAVGLIGRNGAGKSTMLKILARITTPDEGGAIIRGRVGSLLEVGTGFHPELTGRENVYLNGTILGMKRHEIDAKFNEIVEFAEIGPFLDTPVKRYSSGMRMKLAFAVAACLDTDVLLIDEVLAVGDPGFRRKSLDRMKSLVESGKTIIFVSHMIPQIKALCSRCIWFQDGNVFKEGSAAEIADEYLAELIPDKRPVFQADLATQAVETVVSEDGSHPSPDGNPEEILIERVSVSRNADSRAWRILLCYRTTLVRYRNREPSPEWGWPHAIFSIRAQGRVLAVLDSNCVEQAFHKWLPATGSISAELDPAVQFPPGEYSVDVRLLQGSRLILVREGAARFVVPDSLGVPFWTRNPFRRGLLDIRHEWSADPAGGESEEEASGEEE